MREKTALIIFLGLAALLCLSAGASAQEQNQWRVEAKLKRLISSHTSFEFGYPLPPRYAPLSRLQFPLASWWGGAAVSYGTARWTAHLEAFTNLSSEAHDKMKDSDWEYGDLPQYSDHLFRVPLPDETQLHGPG